MVRLQIDSNIIEGVRLVIFDKDGTLMDLYKYWSNMVEYRVEFARKRFVFDDIQKASIMYAMGIDLVNKKLRSAGPVGIKKREIVMAVMKDSLSAMGFACTDDFCAEVFKKADQMSLEHLSEIVKPLKGMHELINTLHEQGCYIAIATTDKTERAKLAVKFLNISDKVDIIVGEDMVKNHKPYPDMINLILEKLQISKDNAVMVGDAVADIEMADSAGLKASIAVLSGIAVRDRFIGKTNYIVEDISQIAVV